MGDEDLEVHRKWVVSARFGSTCTKIGTIQRRLAWPLLKDDMQIHEAFHILKRKRKWKVKTMNKVYSETGKQR